MLNYTLVLDCTAFDSESPSWSSCVMWNFFLETLRASGWAGITQHTKRMEALQLYSKNTDTVPRTDWFVLSTFFYLINLQYEY